MNAPPHELVDSVRAIDPGSVDLWMTGLDWDRTAVGAAAELLSVDEHKRANRFHNSVQGGRFAVARAILRLLLSKYLGSGPEEITFSYSPTGKPFVADCDIKFNLAHSEGTAAYAFTINQEVGIDLERVRTEFPSIEVARGFFAPEELRGLLALSEPDLRTVFYRCWTRKEAYSKARGFGLSRPLDSFSVLVHPVDGCFLCADDRDPVAPDRWRLLDLPEIDGFAGAIAIECPPGRTAPFLRFRHFAQRRELGRSSALMEAIGR